MLNLLENTEMFRLISLREEIRLNFKCKEYEKLWMASISQWFSISILVLNQPFNIHEY